MDVPMTNNAIIVAQFPKELNDWIWEKPKPEPFSTGEIL